MVSREISEGINWLCSICHQNDFGFGNFILNVIYFFFFFSINFFFFFYFFNPSISFFTGHSYAVQGIVCFAY